MTTLKMPSIRLAPQSTTHSTQVIDGAGDSAGLIFKAPVTGSITKIHAYFSAVSGTPVIAAYLEGVAAGRTPDGVVLESGGASATGTPTAGAWHTFTLGTPASVTLGQDIAAHIKFDSSATSATIDYAISSQAWGGPFGFSANGGAYSYAVANMPLIVVEYATGECVGVAMRASSINPWDSTTTPLRGTKWTPAVACDIDGIWIGLMRVADTCDFAVEIYQAGSGTPIFTVSCEGDKAPYATSGAVQTVFVPTGTISLSAGVAYRFVVRMTTANDPTTAVLMTFKDATTFAAAVGGSEWAYTVNDAQDDSWTDTANAFAAIVPRVVGVSGSSGGLLGPNMRGFFQ